MRGGEEWTVYALFCLAVVILRYQNVQFIVKLLKLHFSHTSILCSLSREFFLAVTGYLHLSLHTSLYLGSKCFLLDVKLLILCSVTAFWYCVPTF